MRNDLVREKTRKRAVENTFMKRRLMVGLTLAIQDNSMMTVDAVDYPVI